MRAGEVDGGVRGLDGSEGRAAREELRQRVRGLAEAEGVDVRVLREDAEAETCLKFLVRLVA